MVILVFFTISAASCAFSFNNHPDAACILYDKPKCNGENGLKELTNDEALSNIEQSFDVASVAIREGCQLVVDTGYCS